jgi:hypothetical protein
LPKAEQTRGASGLIGLIRGREGDAKTVKATAKVRSSGWQGEER